MPTVGVAVEAVREGEESGCPESDEDFEMFRMGDALGCGSSGKEPNRDGTRERRMGLLLVPPAWRELFRHAMAEVDRLKSALKSLATRFSIPVPVSSTTRAS